MKTKNFFKATLLSLLLANLIMAFSFNFAFAQTATTHLQSTAKKYSGVEGQIKDFLCTPSDASTDATAAQGDLYTCINKIYRFALIIASVFGVFMLVIAGFVYMSAEGNEESVTKAKDILVTTVTALVILTSGYILLKFLNPDLVKFQPIQPKSVVGEGRAYTYGNALPVATSTSNSIVKDLENSGCVFQTDKQKTEAPQLTSQLVAIVKNICWNVSHNYTNTQGHPATISSVIGLGQHATNSNHYKGCAVDFADGGGAGFFDPNTKTGRPTGVAIYQEALKAGIDPSRINPGVDSNRTDMLHIDLGSKCPS